MILRSRTTEFAPLALVPAILFIISTDLDNKELSLPPNKALHAATVSVPSSPPLIPKTRISLEAQYNVFLTQNPGYAVLLRPVLRRLDKGEKLGVLEKLQLTTLAWGIYNSGEGQSRFATMLDTALDNWPDIETYSKKDKQRLERGLEALLSDIENGSVNDPDKYDISQGDIDEFTQKGQVELMRAVIAGIDDGSTNLIASR